MDSMQDHGMARPFAGAFSSAADRVPASIAELTALSLLAPPCCSHIALCDGACRDARPAEDDRRATRIGGDWR